MKNIILIIVAILVIIAAAVAAFVLFRGSPSPTPASSGNGGVPTSGVSANFGGVPASQAMPDAPKGPTLTLGTPRGSVVVKNFYLLDPKIDSDGNALLAVTPNYFISYDTGNGSFWIAITSQPFSAWQVTAEAGFLGLLGITQKDACKLSVSEGIPYDTSNALSGRSFPLSFCPTTASL